MHRFKNLTPILLLLLLIAAGCSDKTVRVFQANVPVYTEVATWRTSNITLEAPRDLHHPGKIYLYNNLLIVNEFMQGVHIFDNGNPSAPVNLGFLPVHANVDIAVRNNIMYLDSYTDLLAFNITDPNNPTLVSRANDVFNFDNYYEIQGYDANLPFAAIDPTKGVVTGWKQEKVSEDANNTYYGGVQELDQFGGPRANGTTTNIGGTGQAGSMASFAIYDHYLYVLESWELGVFDIGDGIVHVSDIALNRSTETLFPQDGYLFMGTTTGLSIYSLSNPSNPTFVSDYSHATSCDPVFVQGDKAFVTLRTGNLCFGNTDVLLVVDLSNISSPTMLYEYPMNNPHGLALDGNTLFLCDGSAGLKVFDKTDLGQINNNLISQFDNILTQDVIANNGVLVMTSAEGIFQYSYADLQNISQLSVIAAH